MLPTVALHGAVRTWLADPGSDDPILAEEVKLGCTLAMLTCLDRDHRIAYVLADVFDLPHRDASELCEVSEETYRQRLSRARRMLEAFTQRYCGLVDPRAPCRCEKRVARALELGRIERGRPRLAIVAAARDEIESLHATARLMRGHPRYRAPADLLEAFAPRSNGRNRRFSSSCRAGTTSGSLRSTCPPCASARCSVGRPARSSPPCLPPTVRRSRSRPAPSRPPRSSVRVARRHSRCTAPSGAAQGIRTKVTEETTMKIAQMMTRNVKTCRQTDTLDVAARLMWDFDIGVVPVVDDLGQVVGMVTDRDACMAAYTQGQPLHCLPVTVAMNRHVVTCQPDDTDAAVAKLMAKNKIRRVPVVDDAQKPVGMVSLNDLALSMARGRDIPAGEVAGTLAAICEHRPSAPIAAA